MGQSDNVPHLLCVAQQKTELKEGCHQDIVNILKFSLRIYDTYFLRERLSFTTDHRIDARHE